MTSPKSLLFTVVFCCTARAETVQGTVIDSLTRQPIRKASVTITTLARDRSYAVAITDATGHFTIPDIPPGSYTLAANHAGYLSVPYRSNVQIVAAKPHAPVTLLLTPATLITGTVTDPEGDGVPGATVLFYKKGAKQTAFRAATDQHGVYRAGPVLAGEFTASVSSLRVPVSRAHPVVTLGEELSAEAFAPQTYPSPVILRADRDTTDINFHLTYAPQVSIQGILSGIPEEAKHASMTLRASDLAEVIRVPVDQTNWHFKLAGLTAGTYRVEVQAGTRRSVLQVPLYAMGTELNVTLEPGIAIEGSIKIENPSTDRIIRQTISLTSRDSDTPMNLQATVEDGEFEFEEVPAGNWEVVVRAMPQDYYIKSMRLGTRDLLHNDMTVGTGPQGPLSIVISGAAPIVRGTVEPAQAATILAASVDNRTSRTVQSNEAGHFTIHGLPPGTYRFYAFHELEPESWQAPNFLRSHESQSKLADLKEATTEILSLTVIGGGQ